MNYTTDFKSIRAEVSAQEWQARVDLAACYRLIDKYGMTDLIYNHITARIPGSKDHLLINLYGMLYKEITASSLVKIDVEGEIIWKPETDYGINKSGYVIAAAGQAQADETYRRLALIGGLGLLAIVASGGVSVAVVPDAVLGWRAIIEGRGGRYLSKKCSPKTSVDRKRIPISLFPSSKLTAAATCRRLVVAP